ncbi:MOSC domain-containing protein [Brevibacterium yomogidense]|uniref:MOSC domain-containing protein n=1 Tax=Brevibacterium yomogidense TaxID=946573 RepID=UPI0018DF77C8|nr:2Fe-2S iron-sulfur cluster-binding protein [Brevibacterium yomogidense]
MTALVVSLHRYPVKGFPAEGVPRASLEPGAGIPGDRVLAVSDGTAPTVPGTWNRWSHFFALKKRPDLAAWSVLTRDDGSVALTPPASSAPILIDPTDPDARDAAAAQVAHHLPGADPDAVGIITAYTPRAGQGMFDSEHGHVSLISLSTLRALAQQTGAAIDPLRFRGNLLVDGWEPFEEFDLIGAVVRIGGARLLIRQSIERCTATTVGPRTAASDLGVPRMLATEFGHIHCGVYGTVLSPGEVHPDDPIILESRTTDDPLPAATGPRSMSVVDSAPLEDGRHLLRLHDPYRWFPVHWEPGQHVRVHLPVNGRHTWRTYTAVLADGSGFSLIIGVRGAVSTALSRLMPGDRLTVSGPFGALTAARVAATVDEAQSRDSQPPDSHLHDPRTRGSLTLVTSGVGITTALSLLPGLPHTLPVTLLHIDRAADEGARASVDALRRLASAPARSLTVWDTATTGRPGEADLAAAVTGASAVVVCGGAEFVAATTAVTETAGVPSTRIHREAFTSPVDDLDDRLQDFPPAVVERPDGTRLTWTRDDGTLLDALEADGARIPFTCRSGSCGTCTIAVDDPSSTVQVLDATADPGPGRVLACSSVPVGVLRILRED